MSILTEKSTGEEDEVGSILFKLQEDISQIRSQLLTKGTPRVDRSTLKNLLSRAEFGVKNASETYVKALNKQVMVATSYHSKSADPRPNGKLKPLKLTMDHNASLFNTISPGLRAKIQHESRILTNPENLANRALLREKFKVQLPTIAQRPASFGQVMLKKGSNFETLGAIPKSKRVNPFLPPPAIREKDTQAGIFSLVQRGLIPPASDLKLEPSPIENRKIGTADDNKAIALCDLGEQNLNEMVDNWANSVRYSTSSRSKSEVSDSLNPPQVTPATGRDRRPLRVSIKDGALRTGDDYEEMKQRYCIQWADMELVIDRMEEYCQKYKISVGFIDGNRVKELSDDTEAHLLTDEQILGCFSNRVQLTKVVREPGRQFKGTNGDVRAAVMIQKTFRRYVCRKKYIKYRELKWSAGMIAISWIMRVKLSKMRRLLFQIRQEQLQRFKDRQGKFAAEWDRISQCRRVEIHLPSLGFSQRIRDMMSDLPVIENLQMSRLCSIADKNVDVVYISPLPISDDVMQYYNRLLGLTNAIETGNLEEQQDVQGRFRLIVPDHLHSFQAHHMSLATLLKYSPKTMRQIKTLIFGRDAYIVPGILTKDDLAVADALNVPMLAAEPEVQRLYSTKSGIRRIFDSAKVPMPPGDCDIYSMNQLCDSLAQLITENIIVTKWLLKIDDSFDGRGIASFDSTKLPSYYTVLKEARRYGDKWVKKWAQEPSFVRILSELPDALKQYVIPSQPKVYTTNDRFLEDFKANGGVIEAYPPGDNLTNLTVDMLIAPNGKISFEMSGDQIHANNVLQHWGYSCPQSSVEPDILNQICMRIAEGCKKRSIIGYLSIDFVTFVDELEEQRFWATDLSLRYSDLLAMSQAWRFATRGNFDADKHLYKVPRPLNESTKKALDKRERDDFIPYRYAVLSNRLSHTNLQMVHYSVFFQMCRAHGIGFDIKERQGTVFLIVNAENRRRLAMITVFDDLQGALVGFARNLHVIHQEVSAPHMQGTSNFKGAIEDIEGILGTTMENASSYGQKT